jgi:hypothetical protein
MNKTNFKKFDLQKALNGAKVVTRLGNPVTVHCLAGNKVLVTICSRLGEHMNRQVKVNLDGSRYSSKSEHFEDLMIA